MGVIYVIDPVTGRPQAVRIAGDQPSATERQRIDQALAARRPAPVQAPTTPEVDPNNLPGTALGRGVRQGLQSGRAALGSALEEIGIESGIAGLEEFGRGQREAGQAAASAIPGVQRKDVEGFGDALSYGGQALGQGLGSLVPTLAGSLAGGAVGGPIGAVAGGAAASGPMLFGGNIMEQAAQGAEDPDAVKAALVAVPQTMLEIVLPSMVARGIRLTAKGERAFSNMAGRGVEGLVAEGGTEVAQEAMTMAQAGVDLQSPEAVDRLIDAAIGGGLAGGAIGAGAGLVGGRREPQEEGPDQQVLADLQEDRQGALSDVLSSLQQRDEAARQRLRDYEGQPTTQPSERISSLSKKAERAVRTPKREEVAARNLALDENIEQERRDEARRKLEELQRQEPTESRAQFLQELVRQRLSYQSPREQIAERNLTLDQDMEAQRSEMLRRRLEGLRDREPSSPQIPELERQYEASLEPTKRERTRRQIQDFGRTLDDVSKGVDEVQARQRAEDFRRMQEEYGVDRQPGRARMPLAQQRSDLTLEVDRDARLRRMSQEADRALDLEQPTPVQAEPITEEDVEFNRQEAEYDRILREAREERDRITPTDPELEAIPFDPQEPPKRPSNRTEIARRAGGKKPLRDYLISSGRIAEGSELANELFSRGYRKKDFPGLIAKDGNITDVDMIDASDTDLAQLIGTEGDGRTLDRGALVDAIIDEASGRPFPLTREMLDAQQQLQEFDRERDAFDEQEAMTREARENADLFDQADASQPGERQTDLEDLIAERNQQELNPINEPVPQETRENVQENIEAAAPTSDLANAASAAVPRGKAEQIAEDVKEDATTPEPLPRLKDPKIKGYKYKREGDGYVITTPTGDFSLTEQDDGWYISPVGDLEAKTWAGLDAQASADEFVNFQQQVQNLEVEERTFDPDRDMTITRVTGNRVYEFGEDGPFTRVETPFGEFRLARHDDTQGLGVVWRTFQVSGDPIYMSPDGSQPSTVEAYSGNTQAEALDSLRENLSGKKVRKLSAIPGREKPASIGISDQEISANRPAVEDALTQHLGRMGFKDIKVMVKQMLEPQMFKETGAVVEGAYEQMDGVDLINLATARYKPGLSDADLAASLTDVLNHELIHAVKPYFNSAEWDTLGRVAEKRQYVHRGQKRSYTFLDREKARNKMLPQELRLSEPAVREEAIAELFRNVANGNITLAGKPATLWQRFKDFFKNLATAGHKYRDENEAAQIFDDLQSGRLAERGIFPATPEGAEAAKKFSRTIMDTDAFKKWNKNNAVVDKDGNPVVLYRSVRANDLERAQSVEDFEPSWLYGALFASSDPLVASGYRAQEGASRPLDQVEYKKNAFVMPFFVKAKKLIVANDLPRVKRNIDSEGYFEYDDFDEVANNLKKGEVAVIRNVRDPGAFSAKEFLGRADTYAFNEGVDIMSPWDFAALERGETISSLKENRSNQRMIRQFMATPGFSVDEVQARDIAVEYGKTRRYINRLLGMLIGKTNAERATMALYTKFIDKMQPVGEWLDEVRSSGYSIADTLEPKRQEEVMHGIVGDKVRQREEGLYNDAITALRRLELGEDQVNALRQVAPGQIGVYESLMEKARERETLVGKGIQKVHDAFYGGPSMRRIVGDVYLVAKHAKSRNEYIKNKTGKDHGSGMSDQEADAILQWARGLGDQYQVLEDFAGEVQKVVADTNANRLAYGLKSKGQMNDAETMQFYVPLRGKVDPETGLLEDDLNEGIGASGDIKGKEDPSILGRDDYAGLSPLAQALAQNQQTIIRGERNEVNKAMANLIRDERAGIQNARVWEKMKSDQYVDQRGNVRTGPDQQWANSDNVVAFKENGRTKYLEFDNQRIGRAMKIASGAEHMNQMLRMLASFNRFLSNMNTSWNPDFALPNMFRDIQTAMVNANQYEVENVRGNMLKNIPHTMRPLGQYFVKGKRPEQEDIDYTVPLSQATPNQRLLRLEAFMKAGGKNVLNQMGSAVENMGNIDRKLADLGHLHKEPGFGVKARKRIEGVLDTVEGLNEVAENASRFAFYDALVMQGVTPAQAAQAARNLTTNFTAGGEYKTAINALYLFYNASLQGSMALINATVRSRKAQKAMMAVIGMGILNDQIMSMFSGEDEDGRLAYDKMWEYDLSHNIIIPNFLSDDPRDVFKVPLAYGINMPFNFGRAMSRYARGGYRPEEVWETVSGTLLETFNPFGDNQSPLTMAAPTALDPAVSLGLNINFAGQPIYREQYPGEIAPDAYMGWSTTSPTLSAITKALNDWTGGTPTRSGLIDINPEVLSYYGDFFTGALGATAGRVFDAGAELATEGKIPDVRSIPIARRLMGSITEREDMNEYRRRKQLVDAAWKEFTDAREARDRPRMIKARDRYQQELRINQAVRNIENSRRKIREAMNKVRDNKALSPEKRAELLDQLEDRHKAIVNRGLVIMKEVV